MSKTSSSLHMSRVVVIVVTAAVVATSSMHSQKYRKIESRMSAWRAAAIEEA